MARLHRTLRYAPAMRSSVAMHALQEDLMRSDSDLVVVSPPNRARNPMPHRRSILHSPDDGAQPQSEGHGAQLFGITCFGSRSGANRH